MTTKSGGGRQEELTEKNVGAGGDEKIHETTTT